VTCGGTIYCAGSNDPTIIVQGIDREALTAVKAQLNAALKEVDQYEKRLANTTKG
jgi:ribosomal protein L6P/L9E